MGGQSASTVLSLPASVFPTKTAGGCLVSVIWIACNWIINLADNMSWYVWCARVWHVKHSLTFLQMVSICVKRWRKCSQINDESQKMLLVAVFMVTEPCSSFYTILSLNYYVPHIDDRLVLLFVYCHTLVDCPDPMGKVCPRGSDTRFLNPLLSCTDIVETALLFLHWNIGSVVYTYTHLVMKLEDGGNWASKLLQTFLPVSLQPCAIFSCSTNVFLSLWIPVQLVYYVMN